MGNAGSCAPSLISTSGAIKILLSNGTYQLYTKPVKTAQVMMENPGQFVCQSTSLKVGQRIHGLPADQELQKGQIYFLLPMDLLYSVLTQDELSSLSCKTSKAFRFHNHFGKIIFPVCIFPSSEVNNKSEVIQTESKGTLQLEEMFSKQRSWKPALETILETPSSRLL